MDLIIHSNEFMPEIYYSFSVYPSNNLYESYDFYKKTLLLKHHLLQSSIDFNQYENIIGLNEKKKIKINGELLENCKFSFISNVEIIGKTILSHFLYLHESIFDKLVLSDDYILNGYNTHFICQYCIFHQPIQLNNLTNLLLEDCQFINTTNLNIINLIYISLQPNDIVEKYYIYNYQSATLNVFLQLYKHLQQNYLQKPLLVYKQNKYFLKFIKGRDISYYSMDYCISPGVFKPNNKGISIYSFLQKAIGRQKVVIIPNGIYYLDKKVEIDYHLIGIGFPIIHFIRNGQIIMKKSYIMIEGFRIRNYTHNFTIVIEDNHITLMNICIRNERKKKLLEPRTMILIESDYNFIHNLWLFNRNKNYNYGIINAGNHNLILSIYSDAFLESNILNTGLYTDVIFFNSEIIQNLGILSNNKIILLGSSFFSYSVISENYKITLDSIIKNTYILYLDDYMSIHESKLLYFPYFINYDKSKKEENKVRKIIYHPQKQLFLLCYE